MSVRIKGVAAASIPTPASGTAWVFLNSDDGTLSYKDSTATVFSLTLTDPELSALAGLTSAANKIPMFSGSGTATLLTLDTDSTLAANSDTTLATQKAIKTALALKATIASPTFTGTPAAPTATGGTNTTQIATTAFVTAAVAAGGVVSSVFGRTGAVVKSGGDYAVADVTGAAPLASPTFTGTPAAPTASPGTNTTQVSTTAFVTAAVAAATTGVSSVFGRSGAVVKASGDYAVADVTGAAALASPALTGNPTAPTQSSSDNSTKIATTAYVDGAVNTAITGLAWKQPVRAATTANGTLATAFANTQVVDGVTLATGDRILLKSQSSASENGIYVVAASGAPTRATDADSGAELVNATTVVMEGTTNADTTWTCTTNATITVNSTSLAFAQVGTSGASGSAGGDLSGTYPNPTVAKANGNSVPSGVAKGDLLVGSAANTLSKLAVGTDGYVITADSGQATGIKYTSPSAFVVNASSGIGRYDPMALRPGQSASALDDEWTDTGTTLNARWTGNGYWPPTSFDIDTTYPKHLYATWTTINSHSLAILQAVPAGDFVMQVPLTMAHVSALACVGGLILTDGTGTTANCLIAANYQNGVFPCISVQHGTIASITSNDLAPENVYNRTLVLRIERASGVYTAEFSDEGIVGFRTTFTPGFTPTHLGLFVNAVQVAVKAAFGTFRYSATATTRWGAYL